MLAVLTIINIINVVDRTLISVLVPDIKRDLQLTDTQIGLLTGLSFAVFYVLFGLFLGWLAERINRTRLISLALTVWSGMTFLSGAAGSFFQILLCRFGVATGEAGGSPPSYGMIADAFPQRWRPTAMSIFTSAATIGAFVGLTAGGWIAQIWGWRMAFYVTGAAGLLFVPLILFTVADPKRGATDAQVAEPVSLPYLVALKRLLGTRSFRRLMFAGTMSAFAGYGLMLWLPSFLARSYGLSPGETGSVLGIASITTGLFGTYAAGEIARRLGERNLGWWAYTPALGFLTAVPALIAGIWFNNMWISIAAIFFCKIGMNSYVGPLWAATSTVAPIGTRSIASSVMLFGQILLGLGLGPLLIGVMSDSIEAAYGQEALRYSLMIPVVAYLIGAFAYYMAGRTLEQDIAAANSAR